MEEARRAEISRKLESICQLYDPKIRCQVILDPEDNTKVHVLVSPLSGLPVLLPKSLVSELEKTGEVSRVLWVLAEGP